MVWFGLVGMVSKFQDPTTTPSGRKVTVRERRRRKKNNENSGLPKCWPLAQTSEDRQKKPRRLEPSSLFKMTVMDIH